MTLPEIPRMPEDQDWTCDKQTGFDLFWQGVTLPMTVAAGAAETIPRAAAQMRDGWFTGHRRCYGMGVKASMQRAISNPYLEFSPAWEAWGEGYNDEPHLDGGA